MKLWRRIAAVSCAVFMVFAVSGCGDSQGPSGKTVYFASHDVPVDFMASLYEGVKRQGQELGLTVEYLDAGLDYNLQMDQVNKAIDSKAAAIVLLPVDSAAAVPAVERANKLLAQPADVKQLPALESAMKELNGAADALQAEVDKHIDDLHKANESTRKALAK